MKSAQQISKRVLLIFKRERARPLITQMVSLSSILLGICHQGHLEPTQAEGSPQASQNSWKKKHCSVLGHGYKNKQVSDMT